ncbi:MAG: hypothetical protein ACYDBT_15370 [Desulfobulbaceae bacterium]
MKTARLLLPILLVGMSSNGAGVASGVALDPVQELFFSQFRTAIHGEDARQLIRLTHPQARQCTGNEDQEYYYGLILKGLVQMLGHRQTITEIESRKVSLQDIQQISDTGGNSSMKWPVPPEEQLLIRYEKDGVESTATLYIARDQDQWKWVHLCYQ